jgi:hypothetical protein
VSKSRKGKSAHYKKAKPKPAHALKGHKGADTPVQPYHTEPPYLESTFVRTDDDLRDMVEPTND